MSSFYLLLGMLGSQPNLRLGLERMGLSKEKLIAILPQWAEQENLRDLGQDEAAFNGDVCRLWYARQAYSHLWVRDFTGALLWARESTRHFSRHADSWSLLGLVHARAWLGNHREGITGG
ncbi:hypothetical protein IV102_14510 [bacterium]|nr:hypothetical protein [bacterium]